MVAPSALRYARDARRFPRYRETRGMRALPGELPVNSGAARERAGSAFRYPEGGGRSRLGRGPLVRRGGRVVRQGPAKPRTPVRFRSPPRDPLACGPRALSSGGERFLDAEEVRGSNPLAPTTKGPGHQAFSAIRVGRARQPRHIRNLGELQREPEASSLHGKTARGSRSRHPSARKSTQLQIGPAR